MAHGARSFSVHLNFKSQRYMHELAPVCRREVHYRQIPRHLSIVEFKECYERLREARLANQTQKLRMTADPETSVMRVPGMKLA